MGSKILEFLGLSSHSEDAVDESRRRNRRDDYMKKFHGLVDPEGDEGMTADEVQPVKGYVAVKDDPLTEENPVPVTPETVQTPPEEEMPEEKPTPASFAEKPQRHDRREMYAAPEKTFSSRLRNFGGSLRRPKEGAQPLVLIKKSVLEMLDDVEEALLDGRTVLLDFEKEDRRKAVEAVTRIVNFVRVHNGAYYTVTNTSLLLSLEKNSVIEWLPENDMSEQ